MPTYTYKCKKCNQKTEVIAKFSDPHPERCNEVAFSLAEADKLFQEGKNPLDALKICDGELVRVFDKPNVIYRNSGFYSIDKRVTPVKPEDYNPDED